MAVVEITGGNGRALGGNTSPRRGRNKSWNGARWESYITGREWIVLGMASGNDFW